MEIRKLREEEKPAAMELAWTVFQRFEAPEYPPQGIRTFRDYITDPAAVAVLTVWGALENGRLIGVLALREGGTHISLFFVDSRYHRQGVGKALFQRLLAENGTAQLTVNSSPYAVEVYRHLGFHAMAPEQLTDGIRYTPMRYDG